MVTVVGYPPSIPFDEQGESCALEYIPNPGGEVLDQTGLPFRAVYVSLMEIYGYPVEKALISIRFQGPTKIPGQFLELGPPITAYTDNSGQATVLLRENASGKNRTWYEITITDTKTGLRIYGPVRFVVGRFDSNILDLVE